MFKLLNDFQEGGAGAGGVANFQFLFQQNLIVIKTELL